MCSKSKQEALAYTEYHEHVKPASTQRIRTRDSAQLGNGDNPGQGR